MAETVCGACGAKADSPLCWPCAKELRHALVGNGDRPGLVWSLDRLAEAAYGEAKLGGTKQRRGTDTPLLINERTSNLLRDISKNIDRWFALATGRRERVPSRIAVHYLGSQVGHLMGLDFAPSMLKTVQGFNAEAIRIINRPPEVYCGPCQGTLESGEVCGFELRADEDARHVTCRRCGATHDVDAIRERLLARVDNEPQPSENIHRILGWVGRPVPRREFRAVIATVTPRMYLQPNGERNLRRLPESVALYAYGDVIAALENPAQDTDSGSHRRRRRPVRGVN